MKRFFLLLVVCLICSIASARKFTLVVGEPLSDGFDKVVLPGTWRYPQKEGVAVLAEVKSTEEGKGYFKLFATTPSRELTYHTKVGDKFFIENRYSYYLIRPYTEPTDMKESDIIWTVLDIQDNKITFNEEKQH